jgi:hypothetical protein
MGGVHSQNVGLDLAIASSLVPSFESAPTTLRLYTTRKDLARLFKL